MAVSVPWEQSYPPQLHDYRLDPQVLRGSVANFSRQGAERYADAPAFTIVLPNGLHADLSFKEADRLAEAFATYLLHDQQLSAGDVVAIQLPNSLHYPIAVLGAWKAGMIVTNINPLYTPRELEAQLIDSGARLLVACDLFVGPAEDLIGKLGVRLVIASLSDFFAPSVAAAIQQQLAGDRAAGLAASTHQRFSEALEIGATLPSAGGDSHPVALYQYTGGTTGRSKAAVLSHANLLAVLRMAEDYLRAHGLQMEPGDAIATLLPMYHIFAFNFNFLLMYLRGGRNLLVPNPRPLSNAAPIFDMFEVRWMTGVDTLFAGLLAEPWFQARPPALKLAVSGGTSLRSATAERWQEQLGLIVEGYGLTETCCFVSFNPPGGNSRLATVGLPMPGSQVRIVDEQGLDLALGTPGELLVRGPHIMERYLNNPQETENAFVDGWFRTGDIAVMDEQGYLSIVDRKKDMILVSGFNVYPNEIEDVIAQHPAVAEVAVIGVPDEHAGEAIKAFITLLQPEVDAAQIIEYCRQRLTAYKVPRQIAFCEQLPKSPVGKVLRAQLRNLP